MSGPVRVVENAGILEITLKAPETRNALSNEMLDAVGQALHDVNRGLAGVVIAGAGSVFSAGADFRALKGNESDVLYDARVSEVVVAIMQCPVPVVAAVEGPCMGAAADLALACDFRILSSDSFMEIPAARLGIIYNPSTIRRMQGRYRDDALRRLFLLGERVSAPDAVSMGLATQSVPAGTAAEAARLLLASPGGRSGDAVAGMKAVFNNPDAALDEGSAIDRERRRLLSTTERQHAVAERRPRSASTQDD
ncbi:MAG: enoyl-CoA hydratase [Actinomycetota bacterium]|jgi:enoyl-CoA hydratase/carnithine racemase|nr:enoyl-CoA hydratase [Actinomycetota bacterium]